MGTQRKADCKGICSKTITNRREATAAHEQWFAPWRAATKAIHVLSNSIWEPEKLNQRIAKNIRKQSKTRSALIIIYSI